MAEVEKVQICYFLIDVYDTVKIRLVVVLIVNHSLSPAFFVIKMADADHEDLPEVITSVQSFSKPEGFVESLSSEFVRFRLDIYLIQWTREWIMLGEQEHLQS